MAQVVPLNWQGSFLNFGGPLASGASDFWWASGGDWGRENRFYLFSVFLRWFDRRRSRGHQRLSFQEARWS